MTSNLFFNIKLSKKDLLKGLKLPLEINEDLAYLCGIIVGDGSIYKRIDKNDYILKIVGNPKDEKGLYHDVISRKFEKVFGFTPKVGYQDSNTTYGFTIHSKTLFTFLTEVIGMIDGRKDERLGIPKLMVSKKLMPHFIRGLFDTDGCISFKKRYKEKPYYPVITLSSKSKRLILETSKYLKSLGFNIVEIYDYKLKDSRIEKGFTVINRIELNGEKNLDNWLLKIGFNSPKHLKKIEKYGKKK